MIETMVQTQENITIILFAGIAGIAKLICAGEQHSIPYKTYFGEDAIDKFISDITNESEYCCRLLERSFNKTFAMAEKNLCKL